MRPLVLFSLLLLAVPIPADRGIDVERASVRLDGGGGGGGGCTMISTSGKRSWGVTAAHCVGKVGSTVGVIVGGKTLPGKVVVVDGKQDLALIAVSAGVGHVSPVKDSRTPGEFVTVNERGRFGLIIESEGEPRYDVVNRRMYERRVFRIRGGVCRAGDSGTGVFAGGKLVGVVTHGGKTGDSKVLMSPTLGVLRSFLRGAQEMGPLGGDYRSWGDKDRTREILLLQKQVKALELRLELVERGLKKQAPAAPAGKPGVAGPAGPRGERGPAGSSPGLEGRLVNLEEWRRKLKIRIPIRFKPKKE